MKAKRGELSGAEFLALLDELEIQQNEFAELVGAGLRTVHSWRLGERAIPGYVVRLVKLLVWLKQTDEEKYQSALDYLRTL